MDLDPDQNLDLGPCKRFSDTIPDRNSLSMHSRDKRHFVSRFLAFLGHVTIHNTHLRLNDDPDLFLFDACVNAIRIATSIIVDGYLDCYPVLLLHVNRI